MKLAMASDHGGYELKIMLKSYLKEKGYEIIDLGTDSTESTDYPSWGKACAEYVANGKAEKGIVLCGTGIGISIAANKIKGIRCALVTSEEMAKLTAEHNQANILSLGGRTTSFEEAKKYIDIWLSTPPDLAERHVKRVEMLNNMG